MNPDVLDSPIARRFHDLPNCIPGHFTRDEVLRAANIHEAEGLRHRAELYALALVGDAFARHPNAEIAGEAIRLAGLEKEYVRRVALIPEADEVGMKWLINEVEQSIAAGTCLVIPSSG